MKKYVIKNKDVFFIANDSSVVLSEDFVLNADLTLAAVGLFTIMASSNKPCLTTDDLLSLCINDTKRAIANALQNLAEYNYIEIQG